MVALSPHPLDKTFSALAHPLRRAMLSRLAQGEVASISELASPFDVSLMAVSKHVRVLEEAGLLRRTRDGRVHRCSFRPSGMRDARDWIELHRRYWDSALDALTDYLEDTP